MVNGIEGSTAKRGWFQFWPIVYLLNFGWKNIVAQMICNNVTVTNVTIPWYNFDFTLICKPVPSPHTKILFSGVTSIFY
jgi:hypothetical protein